MTETTLSEDSWALKELADALKEGSAQRSEVVGAPELKGYRALLAESLDHALEMVGRSGREVLYGLLERRYDLRRGDIVDKPGLYVSALRDLLGNSCTLVERSILASVKEATGIEAHTLEEAVFKLKERFGEV